ncbi:class I SAM-dependent methyltransferase [Corallococcus exiguus]|uniref:Methyltransferase domain-containing protein n=1 Tax=Corallococcus exiguus TaxID=83462 RepID=A0A7X4YFD9_9BACT|nr:methyltransferase [Corallococcus exiguus]NBC44216.1 methyltransferase domain-containing protein [Corallococcus exiguus]TNV62802.1 class I SAM-dependent methyltransferase [Corallococcus exiguus]
MTLFRPLAVFPFLGRWSLCLALVTMAGACRSETKAEAPPAPVEAAAPELHGVGGVEGVDAAYDRSRQPARFVSALGLAPGQRVADVGAGLGYFTQRLAEAVGPTGQVVATDINDEAIHQLRARVLGRKNIEVRKVAPDAPGLEAGAYDLILLSEVDHFFGDRVDYLTRLRPALTPQGRIAVTHLRAMRPPLVAAAQAAGYTIVSEYNDLPAHYMLFLRPAVSP